MYTKFSPYFILKYPMLIFSDKLDHLASVILLIVKGYPHVVEYIRVF